MKVAVEHRALADSRAVADDPVIEAIRAVAARDDIAIGERTRRLLERAIALQAGSERRLIRGFEIPVSTMASLPGRFFSFEGMDGVGKSTAMSGVIDALTAAGREVVQGREPGGTPAGEAIREVLLYKRELTIDQRCEAALFAANRAQIADEVIRPALERGALVICDRNVHSSLAYQGVARGLGIEEVAQLSRFALGGLWPSRTLLLELSPEEAARRRDSASGAKGALDRIEQAGLEFQRKVAEGFELAKRYDPDTVVTVLADGDPDTVAARCLSVLQPLLY